MRYILALAVVAMLVSPAFAAWDGDYVYGAQDTWTSDGKSTWKYGTAVAHLNYGAGFYGGRTHSGYDQSEPLCQNDGWTGNDVVSLSRGMVQYDADTVLMLGSTAWGSTYPRIYITQLQYEVGEAMESQGLTNPGRISSYGGAVQPITDGGVTSGRLQLAVIPVGQPGGGYDPGADDGGIDPRFSLQNTIGADGVAGAENVMGLAKDDAGDLYVAARAGTGDARVYKIPGPGSMTNSAGGRINDVLGAPSLLVQKVTPVSWFTGVAVGGGGVYVTDYTVQSVDVYDPNSGALKLSVDLSVPNGLIDQVPALLPEDVRVDPTYAGQGVRLIVQVLDEAATGPLGRVDLLVLDVDPVAGTLLAAKALCDGGGAENGHGAYTQIDSLEVSPDGDIASMDSRGDNDFRAHSYTAESYAASMAAPGSIVAITNGTNSMWSNRGFNRVKGGVFIDPNMVPEPVSMALLALGGLALIRRRK